ncbi:S-crystallin 3-like [Octopus vulgaris]|uniref:S-crystallin 3-like n=1 Tax=Octopus vulgaris TaxID=6645 RepID=A0AA36F2D8_OCTVU|nr:S-crystallin 3-like [Octopus vulgaris]
MPSYTLHYFNHRGRAEICRMLFAAAGVQYNDRRIDCSEWTGMRNQMPCSMLPMLEIDNRHQIPQSMAIARYLAREFGFHGRNNLDMARVDFITDCFYDILDDYMRMYHDKDGRMMFQRSYDNGSSSERRTRFQETCRRILPFMEKTLEMRNGGNQFFMGDQAISGYHRLFSSISGNFRQFPAIIDNFRQYPTNLGNLRQFLKTTEARAAQIIELSSEAFSQVEILRNA